MNPRPRTHEHQIEALSGAHKVTALLLAMGKPLADRVIRQFDDREIRTLARTAMELPPIDVDAIDHLVSELAHQIGAPSTIEGSSNGARALLAGVVPEEVVGEIMGELTGNAPSLIWKKLSIISADKLADFISREQPQVSAFLLSKLDPEKASLIIEKLDPQLRVDLCVRLIALKPIGDAAMMLLAERLGSELLLPSEGPSAQNNHALLGAILNKLEQPKSKAILEHISSERPNDALKLKKYVFGFEDVSRLSMEDRARVFEETPADRTVLALRECEPELVAQILASLSPRARRLVESELASAVKVPRKSIEDARRSISDLALALAERSLIALPTDHNAVV